MALILIAGPVAKQRLLLLALRPVLIRLPLQTMKAPPLAVKQLWHHQPSLERSRPSRP